MNDHLSRVVDKGQSMKPPLITPSASPPVSRHKDKPSAAKRPRLSATPSRSSSSLRPGSSTPDVFDLRVASRDRLLKSWDQLAERYYKPLDEDDIVDLRELKIYKDRGITRGAPRSYAIGSLAVSADANADAEDTASQGVDEENIGEEEDESADELDLLSDAVVPDVPEPYKSWYVPPPDETNAEDAEAFREFEEAEKKRRELEGVEGEEEEDEPLAPAAAFNDEEPRPPASTVPDQNLEDGLECDDDKEGSPEPLPPKPKPRRQKSRPRSRVPSEESDDEFGAWVIDDDVVPARPSAPPQDDIIDLTLSPTPSPPRRPRGRSISRPPTAKARALSRARSKSSLPFAPSLRKKTPEPIDNDAEHERPPSPDMVLQLLTPPRSSSAIESPSLEDEPPPAEPPSPQFPKPRARYMPRPRTPSDDGEMDISTLAAEEYPPPEPIRYGPPKKAKKKWPPTGPKPEVVILVPRKKVNNTSRTAPPPQSEPLVPEPSDPSRAKVDKGKDREIVAQTASPETASTASRRRRSQSQPRISASTSRESDSPQPPPPSRGVKRRRVSSLSSLSDNSPAKVAPTPTQSGASSQQKRHSTHTRSKSGYSSDIPPPTSSPNHSDDEDEADSDRRSGPSHARTGNAASHMSPFPYPPPSFAPYTPRRSDSRHEGEGRHTPFPTTLQDPQAHFMFAQAWHSLSYLMASGAIPAPSMPGSGYSLGLPFPSSPWPPYTPSHQRHRTHPALVLDTPSSEAGPSRSATYSTPTHHPHPYPYSYHPDFSHGTLPPSSPISSPAPSSSPTLRPASVPPGQRSRSRGRRVSFKLDNHDRPLPPTPPRRPMTLASESELGSTPASSKAPKGKGKARAEEEEESSDEEPPPPPQPKRGRPSQRARTPGPPSQRENTVPGPSKGVAKSKAGKRKD